MDETIAAAVHRLHDEGLDAAEIQALLDNLFIMPVFTAHPTEAKRRTVLTKLNRILDALHELDFHLPTPAEVAAAREALREEIVALWQTDDTRQRQPTVLDEVRNGLYYFDTPLFDLAPRLYRELQAALEHFYPGESFRIPTFLRFGSWIGGDRDGNPFVTPAVTEETLQEQKARALRLYQRALDRMHGHLSVSARYGISDELAASIEADARLFPDDAAPPGCALSGAAVSPQARLHLSEARRDAGGQRPPLARRPPAPAGHLCRRPAIHRRPGLDPGEPARAISAPAWPMAGWATSSSRPRCSAFIWRRSMCASTPSATTRRWRRYLTAMGWLMIMSPRRRSAGPPC